MEHFPLSLSLREIRCCLLFRLRAECAIPQCFSRELPEENNNTASVICWHEGWEHTYSLGLAPCLLLRDQTAGLTDNLPWEILAYSSTIWISMWNFFQALYIFKSYLSFAFTLEPNGTRNKKCKVVGGGSDLTSGDPSRNRFQSTPKLNP